MKRYCLKPSIKTNLFVLTQVVAMLVVLTVIAISVVGYTLVLLGAIFAEMHIGIQSAMVLTGALSMAIVYIAIEYAVKNYKSWFVEC